MKNKAVLTIAGYKDSGKTTITRKIFDFLEDNGYKKLQKENNGEPWRDFISILEGKNSGGEDVTIILNTGSDDEDIANKLNEFLNEEDFDILITAVRDSYEERKMIIDTVKNYTTIKDVIVEIPLVKIPQTRSNFSKVSEWYNTSVLNLAKHILKTAPFSLVIKQ